VHSPTSPPSAHHRDSDLPASPGCLEPHRVTGSHRHETQMSATAFPQPPAYDESHADGQSDSRGRVATQLASQKPSAMGTGSARSYPTHTLGSRYPNLDKTKI